MLHDSHCEIAAQNIFIGGRSFESSHLEITNSFVGCTESPGHKVHIYVYEKIVILSNLIIIL